MQPTKEQIGERIGYAIDTAPEELLAGDPPMKRRRVALALGLHDDTLDRYIKGKGDPSALIVWRIGQLTGQPFAWFAGQDTTPDERLAVVAEEASAQITAVGGILEALRAALVEAGAFRLDDGKLDRAAGAGVGKQRSKKRGEAVTVPRESAG